MKYILVLLLALPIIGLSQSGTTLEEYKYCTKGYKLQIESGLDPVKKGYEIKKLYTYYSKSTIVEFLGFIKIATNDLQAIILVVNNNEEKKDYYCMPNEFAEQDIWNMYYDRLGEENNQRQQEIMMAFSNYIQVVGNTEDKKTANRPIYDYKKRAVKNGTISGTNKKGFSGQRYGQGDSNSESSSRTNNYIGGYLAGRKCTSSIPKNTTGHFGRVVIRICVNKEGKVIDAAYTQKGSTTANKELRNLALNAAKKTRFEENLHAPDKQCGTITYKFLPG